MDFSAYAEQKKEAGKELLRRVQFDKEVAATRLLRKAKVRAAIAERVSE
jgi:hypothetical protein